MLNFRLGLSFYARKGISSGTNIFPSLLFLFFSLWSQCYQKLHCQPQVSSLDIEENFSLDRRASLHQSADGQYWIGTENGFFRSNGRRVWKYPINDPESDVIHTQNIQSDILSDSEEKIWFSTYSALHRFDPIKETFTTRQIEENNIVVDNSYRVFHFNPELNQLWLLAGDKLWSYNLTTDVFSPLSASSNAAVFSAYKDPADSTTHIFGAGWMYEWFEVTQINKNGRMLSYRELPVKGAVLVSCPINADSILIGTENGISLVSIKEDSVDISVLDYANTGGSVFDIKRKSNDTFIVCDFTNGIFELDLHKEDLKLLYKNEHTFEKAFATNNEDWVISQPKQQFITLSETPALIDHEYTSSERDIIVDISQDSAGELYVLHKSGNIFHDNKLSGDWVKLNQTTPSREAKTKAISLEITDDTIKVLHTHGIITYLKDGSLAKRHPTYKKILHGRLVGADDQLFVLAEDGMRRYELKKDSLLTFIEPALAFPNEKYGLSNCFILRDGSVLLTYQGQYIFHADYSISSGYLVKQKIKTPGYTTSAIQGQNNEIYLGTNNGIYTLRDANISPLIPFDERLAGISVNSLVIDKNLNLWMGTQRGLYSINLKTKHLAYFSEADGLPTNRFASTSAILRQDGSIAMVTQDGIITFQPKDLLKQRNSIRPNIEKIWVNDVLQKFDTASAHLTELNLPSRKNTIFLKVDHLLADDSPVAGMRFQLLGYEDFPSQVRVPYTIRYPNLPPGTYTLQLTAINRNGLPSGKKSLRITINPPWWSTWWFRTLAVLALALIAAGIYIAGLRRERLKQQRLLDQQARLARHRRTAARCGYRLFQRPGHRIHLYRHLRTARLPPLQPAEAQPHPHPERSMAQHRQARRSEPGGTEHKGRKRVTHGYLFGQREGLRFHQITKSHRRLRGRQYGGKSHRYRCFGPPGIPTRKGYHSPPHLAAE